MLWAVSTEKWSGANVAPLSRQKKLLVPTEKKYSTQLKKPTSTLGHIFKLKSNLQSMVMLLDLDSNVNQP